MLSVCQWQVSVTEFRYSVGSRSKVINLRLCSHQASACKILFKLLHDRFRLVRIIIKGVRHEIQSALKTHWHFVFRSFSAFSCGPPLELREKSRRDFLSSIRLTVNWCSCLRIVAPCHWIGHDRHHRPLAKWTLNTLVAVKACIYDVNGPAGHESFNRHFVVIKTELSSKKSQLLKHTRMCSSIDVVWLAING